MTAGKKDMTFEEALGALEAIVEKLERGEVSLTEAVSAYEEGSRLKTQCQERLDEARLKVDAIRARRGDSNAEATEAFDGASDEGGKN